MKRSLIVAATVLPLVVVGSIAVWNVSGNDLRRVGAIDSASEPIALMWRGAWDAEAKYAPGQVVSFKGAAYVAEQENGGSEPDPWCEDECRWASMGRSAEGLQGPKGDPGPAGPKGDPGAAGPKGDRGPGPGLTGRQIVEAVTERSTCNGYSTNAITGQRTCTGGWTHPQATLSCPPGKVWVYGVTSEGSGLQHPGDSWTVTAPNDSAAFVRLTCFDGG
jgi:hypothetical protein